MNNPLWLGIAATIVAAVAYLLGIITTRKPKTNIQENIKADVAEVKTEKKQALDDARIEERKAELAKAQAAVDQEKLKLLADMVNAGKDKP